MKKIIREAPESDDDLALASRAAWLYHAGGLTQSQVAGKLGITGVKAHRLIARATRAGVVRVLVEGPIGDCIQLEQALSRRYGLRFSRVMPEAGIQTPIIQNVGRAAATVLHGALECRQHRVIGVGHGRTLAAAVDHLPRMPVAETRFVSLLGGLPRRMSANPFDVIHRLAEKTGAEAYLLPVPFFANTAADRDVLLAQRGVAEALELAAEATLCLVGIGEVAGDAFLPAAGAVSAEEVAGLRAAGAVGEVLGRYFDAAGRPVATALHDRVIALSLDPVLGAVRGCEVIAAAGGAGKVAAIRSVLLSGLLTGLITDEPTARRLLDAATPPIDKNGSETWTRKPRTSARTSSPAGSAAGN